MPLQIKIYLGLFTAVAVLIITGTILDFKDLSGLEARVAAVIGLDAKTGKPINDPSKPSDDIFEDDIDRDGIKDELESIYKTNPTNPDTDGDGFLDGEEVASGCDPLDGNREKDCPESYSRYFQRLLETDKNITDEMMKLIAGALQAQDLDFNSPNFTENLILLQDKVSLDVQKLFTIDSAEHPNIVNYNNSPQAINAYQESLGKILLFDIPAALPRPEITIFDIFESFEEKNNPYQDLILERIHGVKTIYNKLTKISVPSSWSNIHKNILDYVKKAEIIYAAIAKGQEDPLIGIGAAASLLEMFNRHETLIHDMINLINEQHFPIPDEFRSWLIQNAKILNITPTNL